MSNSGMTFCIDVIQNSDGTVIALLSRQGGAGPMPRTVSVAWDDLARKMHDFLGISNEELANMHAEAELKGNASSQWHELPDDQVRAFGWIS